MPRTSFRKLLLSEKLISDLSIALISLILVTSTSASLASAVLLVAIDAELAEARALEVTGINAIENIAAIT